MTVSEIPSAGCTATVTTADVQVRCGSSVGWCQPPTDCRLCDARVLAHQGSATPCIHPTAAVPTLSRSPLCTALQSAAKAPAVAPGGGGGAATAQRHKVVFVLGGPGSGKGTQCLRLVEEFGVQHLRWAWCGVGGRGWDVRRVWCCWGVRRRAVAVPV